jgi:DNA mismatch endonuclease (patch repair protein)
MDTLTPSQRSERMRRVRSQDTEPEMELRRIVWSLGYRHKKRRSQDIPGRPDITFVGRKCAIFLHGCFWHRHDCPSGKRTPKSRIDFWEAKFKVNMRRDGNVLARLKAEGWRALVIWECELTARSRLELKIRKFLDA